MPTEVQARADFSSVRYGQCWEDADILAEALRVSEGRSCLSIGSAGDNSFGLLAAGAAHVTAVEMNPGQCACIELRRAAYLELDHDALLELLGIRVSERRGLLYDACRPRLSETAAAFWAKEPDWQKRGIVPVGRFEGYFELFRDRVLPLAHSRREVQELLTRRPADDRRAFYDGRWNNLRWRMIFHVFFSRFVMGRLGRDPAFFDFVEGSVADRILLRVRHALVELDPSENPYLRFILTGTFGDDLPLALRPESFSPIRDALRENRFALVHGTLEEALGSPERRNFDAFNLSDIFEYMSEAGTASIFQALVRHAHRGARLAYWNMLCPRSSPSALADRLHPCRAEAEMLFARDRAFFYSKFHVEEVGS